jgi:hypothetical protein
MGALPLSEKPRRARADPKSPTQNSSCRLYLERCIAPSPSLAQLRLRLPPAGRGEEKESYGEVVLST